MISFDNKGYYDIKKLMNKVTNNKILNSSSDHKKIGVSSLTASILSLKNIKTNARSNQAYLLFGNNCKNRCSFCTQSRNAKKESNLLSRVSWPEFDVDDVINAINKNSEIKKICFQVVASENYFINFINLLQKFKNKLNIPIGASIEVDSIEKIDLLFQNGLSSLGIAIDASSSIIFEKIKKKDFDFYKTIDLIQKASIKYPYMITIHLIVGLGETDYDIIRLMNLFEKSSVTIALFAFTPVKGTEMENYPKLPLKRYRFIQFLRQVFAEEPTSVNLEEIKRYIKFDDKNMIINFSRDLLKNEIFNNIINQGKYLKTSGCYLCNRPFYNDKPDSEDLYNYHFDPPVQIIQKWKNLLFE